MFNPSLDLNQQLNPCCLQFSEETFKNSPFSQNTPCQSHRRNSVAVKFDLSFPAQLFSFLQLLCWRQISFDLHAVDLLSGNNFQRWLRKICAVHWWKNNDSESH